MWLCNLLDALYFGRCLLVFNEENLLNDKLLWLSLCEAVNIHRVSSFGELDGFCFMLLMASCVRIKFRNEQEIELARCKGNYIEKMFLRRIILIDDKIKWKKNGENISSIHRLLWLTFLLKKFILVKIFYYIIFYIIK